MIENFDVLIVCHEKDFHKLPIVIQSIKQNIMGFDKIHIISNVDYTFDPITDGSTVATLTLLNAINNGRLLVISGTYSCNINVMPLLPVFVTRPIYFVLNSLFSYFDSLISKSKYYKSNVSKRIILDKIISLKDNTNYSNDLLFLENFVRCYQLRLARYEAI